MISHPGKALFTDETFPPVLSVCEHFAGTEKTMKKALEIQREKGPVFDLTLDLEDGAPRGGEKEQADLVASLIASQENAFDRVGVRIHDPYSVFWKTDLEQLLGLCGDRIAYITIPKADSHAQIREVIEHLEFLEKENFLEKEIPLHVLIESGRSLLECRRIGGEARVEVLDFGLMDFVSSYRGAIPTSALRSPGQFDHHLVHRAKVEISMAAHSGNAIPSHNVTVDLSSPEAAYEDALRAKNEFGFLRMWSIHPSQIDPILRAMLPDHVEMERAASILQEAEKADWGPIRFENELHDRASYRIYWTLLQRGYTGGQKIPASVERWFE